MSFKAFVAATAMVAVSAGAANAALTVFTSRAAFETALSGGFTTETFNGVVGEPAFRTAPVTVGGLTLQGFGSSQFDRNFIDQQPLQFGVFNVDGTAVVNAVTALGTSGLTVTLASGVRGFGADFAAMQDGVFRTQILFGSQAYTPSVTAGNVVTFLGIVSDTPFTTVTFQSASVSTSDGFAFDNVTFGNVANGVPEPSTWAMMLVGFAGLAFASRRRTRPAIAAA
jgi:hypothetical protein